MQYIIINIFKFRGIKVKSLKSIIKQLNNSLSINYKRKKYLIKNKEIISKYKAMSDEELFIEYVNKKAKYQFHKNFFIGLVLTIFLGIILDSFRTMYILIIKVFTDSFNKISNINIEQVRNSIATLGIIVILIIIISIFIFLRFYLLDISKLYKELLIVEEIKNRKN